MDPCLSEIRARADTTGAVQGELRRQTNWRAFRPCPCTQRPDWLRSFRSGGRCATHLTMRNQSASSGRRTPHASRSFTPGGAAITRGARRREAQRVLSPEGQLFAECEPHQQTKLTETFQPIEPMHWDPEPGRAGPRGRPFSPRRARRACPTFSRRWFRRGRVEWWGDWPHRGRHWHW